MGSILSGKDITDYAVTVVRKAIAAPYWESNRWNSSQETSVLGLGDLLAHAVQAHGGELMDLQPLQELLRELGEHKGPVDPYRHGSATLKQRAPRALSLLSEIACLPLSIGLVCKRRAWADDEQRKDVRATFTDLIRKVGAAPS
jgi:hypothetical protein